jgi:hypothetical protein
MQNLHNTLRGPPIVAFALSNPERQKPGIPRNKAKSNYRYAVQNIKL